MFVIVAGCGQLGAGLARGLSSSGDDVVVVDEQADQQRLGSGFDGVVVRGSPTDVDVLREAGIENAQLLVAVTADDNTNVMAIQIAKQVFAVPMVLARISNPEREHFYRGLGLSTVCPTTTGINQILGMIQKSELSALSVQIDGNLVGVRPAADWVGKPAGEIPIPEGRRLVAIAHAGEVRNIDPARLIAQDDTLILIRSRSCTS